MKKSFTIISFLIVSLVIGLNSCNKKTEVDNETQSVVDNAICEQQFMSIQPTVNSKGINENGIKKINACETWVILGAIDNSTITPSAADTVDANSDGFYDNGPVSFEIDYGNTGCVGDDGIVKTGKIRIKTAKRYSKLNNQIIVSLINYKANNITYSGQINITRSDSVTVTVDVINGHCTNGTWNIDYACTKTLKQIGGYSTKTENADDVFSITGSSNGVNREGRSFTTSITSALIKKSDCEFISSGVLELTPNGFKTRTVDFGSGTCDDDATFSVNGQTVSFKLK